MFFEVAINVFDHHHGGIDHHADTDRQTTERHEIRRLPPVPHQNESHEHAEGNCRGSDERAAKIAEQQNENDQHECFAFDQRLDDGMDTVIDQLGLIIEIDNLNTLRQCFINFRNLTLNAIDDFFGVLVDALENNSRDDFALPVFGDRALTDLIANLHTRHVADANRRAATRIEHDVLDILNVLNQ